MSWDVLVHASELTPPPVREMPDHWKFSTLGMAADVRAKLTAAFPEVDWTDPRWGIVQTQDYTYEFDVGENDPIDHVMVHVRGIGDAVSPLLRLSRQFNWHLLDCSAGEWIHHMNDDQAGWVGCQALRKRILGH